MKVMFSAGEASGDIHAARVARALCEQYPDVEMIGMGGEMMEKAGVRLVYDIKNLGFIGLVEIVKALPFFFALRSKMSAVMDREKPDVFVCVDYPGFNMRMAKVAHQKGIPVLYYIAPTIWAWHKSRGKDIAKYTDCVASIFPFEAEAYKEFTTHVSFVGHPLLDIVHATRSVQENMKRFQAREEAVRILLMPGSRKQEVASLLSLMLESIEKLQQRGWDVQVFLPRAHTIAKEELEAYISQYDVQVTVTEGDNYDVMQICHLCLAASGTATLETALMGLPTVLLYKVAPLTYHIGKKLVKLSHVGLPNIIAGKEIIPELLQEEVTVEHILDVLNPLLTDKSKIEAMKKDFEEMKKRLGEPGAVKRVAQLIAQLAAREGINE